MCRQESSAPKGPNPKKSFHMSLFFRLNLLLLTLPVSLLVCPQPAATTQFTNITKAAGISFTHFKGNNGTSTILEEAGPGVCVLDYDGDGYQNIYFVNGRDLYQRGLQKRHAPYRNNGDGSIPNVNAHTRTSRNAYA